MLSMLRQSRAPVLGLILLSPGIGRVPLEHYHPCPMAAEATPAAMGMRHGSPPPDDATPEPAHHCHCVGTCCCAAVAVTPPSPPVVAWRTMPVAATPFPGPAFTRATIRPARLLPPATAPPRA